MFEEIQQAIQKPTQDMKEMRVQTRVDKFGSIHFTLECNFGLKNLYNLKVDWNKFIGKEVTPEIIKEELEKIRETMKSQSP